MTGLSAPFPYYGGKARWADRIWERFGRADVYVEPFAGSLAVLLANPSPAKREVVGDTDGMICNFWRAIRDDPEAVAQHADYPTIHQDLTARHAWLRDWRDEHADKLSGDPEWFDARAAGWWVWGISLWIGGDWCSDEREKDNDRRPRVNDDLGGRGVAAQRDQIPKIRGNRLSNGYGTNSQRDKMPAMTGSRVSVSRGIVRDQIPRVDSDHRGGAAVTAQALRTGPLADWFDALANRLKRVIVLNRDWTSCVTPSVMADTPSGPGETINRCILLDPPYLTDRRKAALYRSDFTNDSDEAAISAWRWAAENGDRHRIAYFCHEGDFEVPAGWAVLSQPFKGHNRNIAGTKDCAMFSPACVEQQPDLFAGDSLPATVPEAANG